ncbi:hypothetical protein [Thermoflexus sp.]|uniref:hypothetical protein n=1 Tax=Thermoflexus sp. TaxID=1969742 RepID=UPI0025DCA723|nr:hypothetical protein [Thermoflexus sp.]MCS6964153.1 hypothetical protein [Thermoflexus sp.]MCX7689264.1 hypothetical protein [Thermoflexus sp.]MDW8186280.1 hypothetical protein [Anaerolineae bacterium]
MRTSWTRAGMALAIALLALVVLVLGTAWAAGGSSAGLAGKEGNKSAPAKAMSQPSQAGTSIKAHKTAEGFWTHVITYDWSVEKTVMPDALTLGRGEWGEVHYTITATRHMAAEEERAGVRGSICVTNTGERATEGLAITDVVEYKNPPAVTDWTPFITVTVDVHVNPVLDPGESYCYPYEISFTPLPGVTQYRNHAIVTILNHSGWLPDDPNCPGPAKCPFGPEPKEGFSLPTQPTRVEIDESATVRDEEHCPSGFACMPSATGPWAFSDSGSVSFHKTITNVSACDVKAVLHNVATLTESDTHETRKAEAVVHLTAPPCPVGCVLTQGFWKTHPDAWPKGHHPNDLFFRSGKTWMQVLWTAPRGDAYYILAHQYIAAVLNVANGAVPPREVAEVIYKAGEWFAANFPGVSPSSEVGRMLIRWSEVLAAFNEGWMGVPYCKYVEAGPANPPKKGGQRPEMPPGLEKRPETPPGLEKRPATPPGLENRPKNPPGSPPDQRPEMPPGQEHRPSTPPGQEKGKGK